MIPLTLALTGAALLLIGLLGPPSLRFDLTLMVLGFLLLGLGLAGWR